MPRTRQRVQFMSLFRMAVYLIGLARNPGRLTITTVGRCMLDRPIESTLVMPSRRLSSSCTIRSRALNEVRAYFNLASSRQLRIPRVVSSLSSSSLPLVFLAEILEPPFEVTELGWGAFDIGITIEFQDPAAAPVSIVHK